MGRIWMPGGGGGTDLDVITTEAGDILKGKVIVGPDGEPLTGTLELTGDAADSHVLAGKTYYNTDTKVKRTGTMPVRTAKKVTLKCGESCSIDYGYHNGEDTITAASLASQTDSNATAGDILSGKNAWVKGSKVSGNIAVQTPKDSSLNCGGSVTMAAGYYNKAVKVTANSLASQTSADAVAGDIRKGKTAYVNGSKVAGTLAEKAAATYTPSTANQSIAANQILTGAQTIKGDANLVAGNIVSGKSIFGVSGVAQTYKSIVVTPTKIDSVRFKTWTNTEVYLNRFTYGAIDFTPVFFVCKVSGSTGMATVLNGISASNCDVLPNKADTCTIVTSDVFYYGKSGFSIPMTNEITSSMASRVILIIIGY